MKYYDKGFINIYEDNVYLQILSAGVAILELRVYKDEVCKDSFRCISSKDFNTQYLSKSYKDDFLYELLRKSEKNIIFRDRVNSVLIKVRKD